MTTARSGNTSSSTTGTVRPYLDLREELSRRDRSLRDKVVSLEEAASFVRDGDVVGIGGSTMSRTPMGMIWALIRAGRKGLTCARSIVSSDGDLLLASGACDHIVTSWFSQGILWGVSKVMRHHVETGKARFDEWSHMAMGMRFRAGAMGIPFMPIRSMLGSDVRKQRPEAIEMDCPFTGEKVLLVRDFTSPDDIRGMDAAQGILTAQGGMTSHAALVARQMGKVCIVGCDALSIDLRTRGASVAGRALKEGDWLLQTAAASSVGKLVLQLAQQWIQDNQRHPAARAGNNHTQPRRQ